MQLKSNMSCHLLNVYTKFQIDISKHVEENSGKRGRTDGRTDGRTLPRHNTSRFSNGRIKRAPLLYYVKLCASFQSHGWIQTGVTVWKRSIRVKIGDFLSCVTLKFDGWPWITIGQFFYAASSFVHHFIGIGELKLEMHNFGQNRWFFLAAWPWNLTDDL